MQTRSKDQPLNLGGQNNDESPPRPVGWADSTPFERRLLSALYRRAGSPPIAVETWDGFRVSDGNEPVAVLRIVDRGALARLLRPSDIGFGSIIVSPGDMATAYLRIRKF